MGLAAIVLALAALVGLVTGRRVAAALCALAWLAYFIWNHTAADVDTGGSFKLTDVPYATLTTAAVLGFALAGVVTNRAVRRLLRTLTA